MVSPNTAKRANARAYAGRLDGRARKLRAVGALFGQRGARVGRDGEFTLAREAGGVRFRGVLYVNRTKALEAVADVARGRGDSAEFRCKVAVPRGATITAVEILARNANASTRSLTGVFATLQELPVSGGTQRALTPTQVQSTGAGETVAIPSDAINPSYRNVPLAAGPFTTTDEGYVDVTATTPANAMDQVQVFHVRVTYTISELDITAL